MKGMLVGLLLMLHVLTAQVRPTTLSICAVVDNPSKYDGRLIAVRGRWLYSMETNILMVTGCNLRPTGNATISLVWPTADTQTLASIRREMERRFGRHWKVLEPPKTLAVMVTFIGVLESSDNGEEGFGHLNASRAQLHVRDARELKFIKPDAQR